MSFSFVMFIRKLSLLPINRVSFPVFFSLFLEPREAFLVTWTIAGVVAPLGPPRAC